MRKNPKNPESQEKSGLTEKCDALYVWHKDIIYAMALKAVGGDPKWALSIVEECLFTVYENIDKFGDEKSDETKSKIIAVYYGIIDKIYDEVRRKMGIYSDYGKISVSQKEKNDVDQILIRNNLTAELAKYVDKLKNAEKEIIFLRFFMGMDTEKISKHIGVSAEETEKRVFFAKQKIAKMMTER